MMKEIPPEIRPPAAVPPLTPIPHDGSDEVEFVRYNAEARQRFKDSMCTCLCQRKFDPSPFLVHIRSCAPIRAYLAALKEDKKKERNLASLKKQAEKEHVEKDWNSKLLEASQARGLTLPSKPPVFKWGDKNLPLPPGFKVLGKKKQRPTPGLAWAPPQYAQATQDAIQAQREALLEEDIAQLAVGPPYMSARSPSHSPSRSYKFDPFTGEPLAPSPSRRHGSHSYRHSNCHAETSSPAASPHRSAVLSIHHQSHDHNNLAAHHHSPTQYQHSPANNQMENSVPYASSPPHQNYQNNSHSSHFPPSPSPELWAQSSTPTLAVPALSRYELPTWVEDRIQHGKRLFSRHYGSSNRRTRRDVHRALSGADNHHHRGSPISPLQRSPELAPSARHERAHTHRRRHEMSVHDNRGESYDRHRNSPSDSDSDMHSSDSSEGLPREHRQRHDKNASWLYEPTYRRRHSDDPTFLSSDSDPRSTSPRQQNQQYQQHLLQQQQPNQKEHQQQHLQQQPQQLQQQQQQQSPPSQVQVPSSSGPLPLNMRNGLTDVIPDGTRGLRFCRADHERTKSTTERDHPSQIDVRRLSSPISRSQRFHNNSTGNDNHKSSRMNRTRVTWNSSCNSLSNTGVTPLASLSVTLPDPCPSHTAFDQGAGKGACSYGRLSPEENHIRTSGIFDLSQKIWG